MKQSRQTKRFNIVWKLSNLIPLIMGLIFIGVAGLLYYNSVSTKKDKMPVEAVISRIDYSYTTDTQMVFVDYTVDGVEYKNIPLNSYDVSMRINKTITVYYDADNPNIIFYANTPTFIYLIILGFGILALVIGLFGLFGGKKGERKLQTLKSTGSRRDVVVFAVNVRWNMEVNGRHPAMVTFLDTVSQVQYQQKVYVWSGQEYLVGDRYSIYVDPHNPDNFAVDFASLQRPIPNFENSDYNPFDQT